jgi:hypothetical protein
MGPGRWDEGRRYHARGARPRAPTVIMFLHQKVSTNDEGVRMCFRYSHYASGVRLLSLVW